MSTTTLTLDCPHCEAALEMSLPAEAGSVSDNGEYQLKGRETNCRQCEHAFEVLFY